MAPVGLNHWMLHADQLASELDETLNLSPGYDPVREVDPELTFHAPLITGPDSIPGAIKAITGRNSEATFQAPRGAFLLSASDDESRHEYTADDDPLGVLMEPASTNKCENYTDNPDAALSGLVLGGDASATMTRVRDFEALHAAGLSPVCHSGYVILLDNSAGSGAAYVLVDGSANNTNAHQCAAYWRGAGNGRIQTTGPTGPMVAIPPAYERYAVEQVPSAGTNRLMIQAEAGAVLYFILNEFEESPIKTSTIISRGAVASRAVDQLSWPINGVINQTEGMHGVIWRPQFSKSDVPSASQRLTSCDTAWLFYQNTDPNGRFAGRTGASADEFTELAAPLEAGKEYVVVMRWSAGDFQIGHKANGAWVWGNLRGFGGILESGSLILMDLLASSLGIAGHGKHLLIWRVDRGTSWLERAFEGAAN